MAKTFVALRHLPEVSTEQMKALGVQPAPWVGHVYEERSKTVTEVWRLVFWRNAEGQIVVGRWLSTTTHGYGG